MITVLFVGLERIVCSNINQPSQSRSIEQLVAVAGMSGILRESVFMQQGLRVSLAVEVLARIRIGVEDREEPLGKPATFRSRCPERHRVRRSPATHPMCQRCC